MMELINKARMHVTEESLKIDKVDKNFVRLIEEHLNDICTTEGVANKLLDPKKSLLDFCKKCQDEARKKARANGTGVQCAGFPDSVYYEMAEEYYNILPEDKEEVTTNVIDITSLL